MKSGIFSPMSNTEIHLHMPEPWMWYESILYPKSYLTNIHRHPAWQLTAALLGEFRFRIPDGGEAVLRPGDWILLSPELLHDVGSDSPRSRAMQIFFRRFPPEQLPEPAERFNLRRGIFRTGHAPPEEFERIARAFLVNAADDAPLGRSWRNVLGQEFVVTALSCLSDGQEGGQIAPSGDRPDSGVHGAALLRTARRGGVRRTGGAVAEPVFRHLPGGNGLFADAVLQRGSTGTGTGIPAGRGDGGGGVAPKRILFGAVLLPGLPETHRRFARQLPRRTFLPPVTRGKKRGQEVIRS